MIRNHSSIRGTSRFRFSLCLAFFSSIFMLGVPSQAQFQCGETAETLKEFADCASFLYSNSAWNLRDDGYKNWQITYDPNQCEDENHWKSQYRDPTLRFRRFSQRTRPGQDQQNLYSLGVDPATLVPEALDLNIFPAIEISSELVLQPSLSYSPDRLISRGGNLAFAPPKRWQNHYGELVLVVGRTDGNKNPVGPPKPGGDVENDRLGIPSEIEVFFINASGQQVSFYPDPDQFQTGDLNVPDGAIRFWFSGEGNYRLEDLNHASDPTQFNWSLKTPDGLTYSFERYLSNFDDPAERAIDVEKEWLCLRFRVKTIADRYGNTLDISYRAANSLHPDVVQAPGMLNAASQPMAIDYDYEAVSIDGESYHRLTEIKIPGYDATTQSFKFYYPDSTADTGTQRHALNGIGGQALALQNDKATLNPLVATFPVYYHPGGSGQLAGLYFDVDGLGFAPRPALDFMRMTTGSQPSFVSAGFWYEIQTTGNPLLYADAGNIQKRPEWIPSPPSFRYRYQLDNYPFTEITTYPDRQDGNIDGLSSGEYQAAILPIVKKGDAVVWQDQSGLHTLEISDDVVSNRQVGMSASVAGTVANAYHIRKDNRLRIAEIEFPSAANSASKRLVLVYDDFSLNHGELAAVRTYDDFGGGEDPQLVSESQYTYERITVASASEEAGEILPETKFGSTPEWEHCIKAGRELNPATEAVQKGLTHGGRFQELDILRQKTVRYRKLPTESGDDNFAELTTRYGGAYHFALLGQHFFNEDQPASQDGDPNRTCDYMVWSLASKPFNVTWQIDPDGSATVFDLSPHGLGLEPALAFANRRRRVFKTYRFDTGFKQAFENAYAPFLDDLEGDRPFTGFYHFMPLTEVDLSQCQTTSCNNGQATLQDLADYPKLPVGFSVPKTGDLFGLSSKCYGAELTTFEWVPLFKYSSTTDAGHHNDFLRRLTVKTLHGSIHWRATHKPGHYFRFSAIKAVADTIGQCQQDPIEVFFKGGLASTAHIVGESGEQKDITINWDYGGRSDVGSPFQYFHDRQQTHRLRPHSQTSLRKLSGFEWDDARNLIDLDLGGQGGTSKWVVEVKRFSNGGYLGTGSGTAAKNFGAEISTIYDPILPPDFTNGDLLVHRNFIYRIDSILGDDILVKPGLKSAITSSDTLHIYRMAGYPSSTYPYVGYDAFGNNGFQAVYKKDKVFWPEPASTETDANFDLVPLFFDDQSHPFSLSLNDSILPQNNDSGDGVTPGEWRFFGRISKQFTGSQLGLTDYSDTSPVSKTGWRYGQTETYSYEDGSGEYAWLPYRSRKPFEVYKLRNISLNLGHVKGIIPLTTGFIGGSPHQEDVVTHYRYFGASGVANTFPTGDGINHGKVALQWSGKSATDDFTQQTATRNQYDTRGRMTAQYTATFAMDQNGDGTTPYVQAQTYVRDANTGLPTSETTKVFAGHWDDAGTSLATTFVLTGSGTTQGRKVTDYDALGRPVEQYGLNAQLQPFGAITETQYHSQTKQTTRTLHPTAEPDLMTEVHQYRNGLGQDIGQWRTRSGETDQAFVKANRYDAFARRVVTGTERMETIGSLTPDAWAANPQPTKSGHSKTRYNQRGEAFGQVLYQVIPESGETETRKEVVSSTWTHSAQNNATGNALTYTLMQTEDANASTNLSPQKLNIKLQRQDDYGMTVSIEDYRKDESDGIWEHMDDDDLAGKVTNPGSMLDKAVYTYDRFGNVIEAEVGLTNTQTRNFAFDQFNRLRLESHPEMTDGIATNPTTVVYSAFDHFDNPTQVSYLDENDTVLRQWQYSYHPSGELAEVKDQLGNTLSDFTYMFNAYLGSGGGLPAFPSNLRFARHHLDQVTAYVHDYDPATGLLSGRSFYHTLPDYPGFAPQIGSVDLTAGSGVEATLPALGTGIAPVTLSYTYNVLGLLKTETYPAAMTGMTAPTQLKMSYGPDGLLDGVEDTAFTPALPLLEAVTYGIEDQPTNTQWARPGGGGTNEVAYERDSLNRLGKWSVQWNSGAGQYSESREYNYDSYGRIWKIKAGSHRIYSYAYDGLGQIKQARLTDTLLGSETNPGTAVYDYTYDDEGLGNLIKLEVNNDLVFENAVDLATNQLQIANADYNLFGELSQMTRNGADYGMGYNAMGRMNAYVHQPASGDPQLSADYAYDHAGMRVFNETTDSGATSARLYFYDDANMVLCEWVSEDSGTPRWDKSYVYFDGKSSLTYEHDEVISQSGGAQPLPAGPSMTHATLLDQPELTWDGNAQQAYDLEIQDEFNQGKGFYKAIAGTAFRAPPFFKAGKYRARVRLADQVWGPWHDFVFVPESARDLAGDYRLNLQGRDGSFFKNHLDTSGLQFIEGLEREALQFQGSESLSIPAPFQHTDQDQVTVAFWVKMPAPTGFQPSSIFQLLKFSGLKVQFNEGQFLRMNWPGTPAQSSGVALAPGDWNHVALVFGNGDAKLYLNHQLILDRDNAPSGYAFGTVNMEINSGNANLTWEGELDQMRFWNRALTATEIQTEYNRYSSGN